MNQRTFNACLKVWGYVWIGEEEMMKGFMTGVEAKTLIDQYVSEGRLKRG
jgi:hypothetical protein